MGIPIWIWGTLGILAIEGSYVPQLARVFRLKSADDVSFLFPALNLGGRLFALVYAASKGENAFSAGLLVGILLRGAFLLQVLWYRKMRAPVLGALGTLKWRKWKGA